MRVFDVTGQRFGRLLVLAMVPAKGNARALCQCDCGKQVTPLAYNLKNGGTRSCGCLAAEQKIERAVRMGHANKKHGMAKTPTYARWQEAKKRCHSPTNKRFPQYGARGIAVCERWRNSFEDFLADMGECPARLTLERCDNHKGYEPGNCIWADRERQAQNRLWNKANPDIVRQIRARARTGEPRQHLADAFGMSISNVEQIIARKTWKNIE